MERRHFLKLAFGAAAGAAALAAASAQAAPLAPYPLAQSGRPPAANGAVQPAVTSTDEVNSLKPEEVRWHHGHGHGHGHGHWHHWHHHHWHHHHWRHHHW